MVASDNTSRPPYLDEFRAWRRAAEGALSDGETQSPTEELLAEHHLMNLVVTAMEREAGQLDQGAELRFDFWSDVVDFIGNFVHHCHRAKEEQVFYPAVVELGLIEAERSDVLEGEHRNAKELTLGIISGVENGDWEQVVRLVSMYAYFIRHHMRSEEMELVQPAVRELSPAIHSRLAGDFAAVENAALAKRNRAHYLDVVRRICDEAGVLHGFDD